MFKLSNLPIEKISAHFSPCPETEEKENSWLPGSLSITEDGQITGEIFEDSSWLSNCRPSFGGKEYQCKENINLWISLQEPYGCFALIENVIFNYAGFRTGGNGYLPIGTKNLTAFPPFTFFAERIILFKKTWQGNFNDILKIKQLTWNLSDYTNWLPPPFQIERDKAHEEDTFLPKKITLSFPKELRTPIIYSSIRTGRSSGKVTLEPSISYDSIIYNGQYNIKYNYSCILDLDEAQKAKEIAQISWAAERFFLTVATSQKLLPYPYIQLTDGSDGLLIYRRYPLHKASSQSSKENLNWYDYNLRGIRLKDNFGKIFQNYLCQALEKPNHYYPLLSEFFHPAFLNVTLLSLASAFEDMIWPLKPNGKRDEGSKSNRKIAQEIIDTALNNLKNNLNFDFPNEVLENFNKAIRENRDALAHGNLFEINEKSYSTLNVLKIFYYLIIFSKIGISKECIKDHLSSPFPLGKLVQKIHPNSGFGAIFNFSKEKAENEIKRTTKSLENSPWSENNLPLPLEIQEYLTKLEEIKKGDGNIAPEHFPKEPSILSDLMTICGIKKRMEEEIEKLKKTTTPIPEKLENYRKQIQKFWKTGEGNRNELIFAEFELSSSNT